MNEFFFRRNIQIDEERLREYKKELAYYDEKIKSTESISLLNIYTDKYHIFDEQIYRLTQEIRAKKAIIYRLDRFRLYKQGKSSNQSIHKMQLPKDDHVKSIQITLQAKLDNLKLKVNPENLWVVPGILVQMMKLEANIETSKKYIRSEDKESFILSLLMYLAADEKEHGTPTDVLMAHYSRQGKLDFIKTFFNFNQKL